jgi:hypothetical protein
MSTVMEKPRTVTKRFELEPRVQLLPAFVSKRSKVRSSIRLGVMLVLLGIILAGGMFSYGVFRLGTAESDLAIANETTQQLLIQQQEFRIATDTAAMVDQTTEAQLVATSYEIAWGPLISAISRALPADAKIATMAATNQAPWDGALEVEDPLRTPRIATIEMVLDTKTVQDALRVNARLARLAGYADSSVLTVAVGTDGRVTTTISLTLSTDAVSGRFIFTEEELAAAAAEAAAAAAEESGDVVTKSLEPAVDATEAPATDGQEG